MYNIAIPSINTAYQNAKQYFSTLPLNQTISFGDYDNLSTTLSVITNIKNNFVQSYNMGSALPNFDEVGIALGRFSLRTYIKANVRRDIHLGYNTAFIELLEVGARYADQYEFKDDGSYSQPLGCWNHDLLNPAFDAISISPNFTCIDNADFRSLQSKSGNKIGKDFLIYSEIKPHVPNNENEIRIFLPN